MSKQATVTLTNDLLRDLFFNSPLQIGKELVRRQTYPEYYSPKEPFCLTPIDFSSGDKYLEEQIQKKVRIAPSHLDILNKSKEHEIISRLDYWVDFVKKILPTIIHPAVLHELFSANMMINIMDYNLATKVNPKQVGNMYGMYFEEFNVIFLYLPTFCTEIFVKEVLVNELIGAIVSHVKERSAYNPLKLPAFSLKKLWKQSRHAYTMGMARIETFARLLSLSGDLTHTERHQLKGYSQMIDQFYHHQYHNWYLFISKELLTALEATGQWQKLDDGSTWQFITATKNEVNKTFYSVLYDPDPREQSFFVYYQHVSPQEFKEQPSKVFVNDLIPSHFRHGDPFSVKVKKEKKNFPLQLYLLEEAFSEIFEYGMPIMLKFFPELCRLYSSFFCLPDRSFCDSSAYPVVEIVSNKSTLNQNINPVPAASGQIKLPAVKAKIHGSKSYEFVQAPLVLATSPAEGSSTTAYCATRVDGSLFCSTPHGVIDVFPKNFSDGSLKPQDLSHDTYDFKTCRTVDNNGPSVFCEGKKTNLMFKAKFCAPLFAQLDGQLLLLQVVLHFIFTGEKAEEKASPQPTAQRVINPSVLKKQLSCLTVRLEKSLPKQQRSGFEFALKEQSNMLEEIMESQPVDTLALSELAEDISQLDAEITEAARDNGHSNSTVHVIAVPTQVALSQLSFLRNGTLRNPALLSNKSILSLEG